MRYNNALNFIQNYRLTFMYFLKSFSTYFLYIANLYFIFYFEKKLNLGNNLEIGYDNHDQTHKPRKPTGFNIFILILLKINQKLYFIKRTNFNIFSLHQKQFKKNWRSLQNNRINFTSILPTLNIETKSWLNTNFFISSTSMN